MTLGYSEAISFAGNCEYCYVIGNEVFDNTNIGIDFYGNAGYCSVEALDQARFCVASYNRVYNCNSVYADCGGIYVDGGRNCLIEGNFEIVVPDAHYVDMNKARAIREVKAIVEQIKKDW